MASLAKSLNCDGRNGISLLASAVILTLLALPAAFMREHFAYAREPLLHGELWRLVTGHLVHLDFSHAVLNVVGLVLVWALYRAAWRLGEWGIVVMAGMLAIDAGLWWLQPQVQWYVGASGVLHALIAAGVVAQWNTERGISLVVAVLFGAKLLWEAWHGALPFAGESHDVVLSAHRYGALGGLVAAGALTLRRKWL
jgi:rhomboid family GlyGly-CTERM serine protease